MKYIFDTIFLLSLIMVDDINHKKAIEIFEDIDKNSIFYINEITYIELFTVITYKMWYEKISLIKNILDDLWVTFLNSWNMEYISFFEFLSKKISVVDSSIIYDSIRYNLEVLTFDKEILKICKSF